MDLLRICTAATLLALALAAPAARAAGGEDSCSAFITDLPATISYQGVWCLRADLELTAADGNPNAAISIETSNVTVDCNGFGLHSQVVSVANGVSSINMVNATVRGCRIEDFQTGVYLTGGSGHLVEDNLIRGSRNRGIAVSGEGSLVRRNRVLETGSTTSQPRAIEASGDVIDNVIDGVSTNWPDPMPMGINTSAPGVTVRGNVVRGVQGFIGIHMTYASSVAIGNHVVADGAGGVTGIGGNSYTYCVGNTVQGYAEPLDCHEGIDNLHD